MSAIFIEKIKDYITRPMVDMSPLEEAAGCALIALVLWLIWQIGEHIYRWEEGRR